jgi:hydrogenase nickel incorporation protein HypB
MNGENENPGGRNWPGRPATEFHLPAAGMIRRALAQAGVAAIRIIGHPGAGKTELVEATLRSVLAPKRVGVIVVNPASRRDAEKLERACGHVAHLDAAAPTASAISKVVSDLKLAEIDLILIESAGGLGQLQDLGQDATVAVFAVSGGDDKAAEYHTLLKASSAVVVTKSDLRPHVQFDPEVLRKDIRLINSLAEIFEVSAQTGHGMEVWVAWLERIRVAKRRKRESADERSPDSYVG